MFRDRVDAGRRLADRLGNVTPAAVVVGLPRGGVVVAAQVALRLGAPLDVIVVRKLGVPAAPEVAMGALGEGGVLVVNSDVVRRARVSPAAFAEVRLREQAVLDDRVQRLRAAVPLTPLSGRTVVVVDDGVATGATARAACQVARAARAASVILAVPVIAPDVLPELAAVADRVVYVEAPVDLQAVGQRYADFSQVGDAEVTALLEQAADGDGGSATRRAER